MGVFSHFIRKNSYIIHTAYVSSIYSISKYQKLISSINYILELINRFIYNNESILGIEGAILKEFILIIADIVNGIHDLLNAMAKQTGLNLTDKDLHL